MKRLLIVASAISVALLIGYPPLRAAVAGAVQGTNTRDGGFGVLGSTAGGVYGYNPGVAYPGVYGESVTSGLGVYGRAGTGVYGQSTSSTGTGVYGYGGSAFPGNGVWGVGAVGVYGYTSTVNGSALQGKADPAVYNTAGLYAVNNGTTANSNVAIYAYAPTGYAIYSFANPGAGGGWAGYFNGDVKVTGTLYKAAGAFKIDHPLDPLNKYLAHSFVESDEMKNVYDGVVTLGRSGEATVELPAWFGALNKDFRYQLTCIGEHAPVYIADEITENHFRIAGGYEGMRVSWQVTGVRHDAYAVAHPILVEESKNLMEKGRLMHPALYKMPATAGIDFERSLPREPIGDRRPPR